MGYVAAILGRRFRRTDVHSSIDGDRVERDDFRPDPACQFHADGRLARRRRAGEEPAVTHNRVDRATFDHPHWYGLFSVGVV